MCFQCFRQCPPQGGVPLPLPGLRENVGQEDPGEGMRPLIRPPRESCLYIAKEGKAAGSSPTTKPRPRTWCKHQSILPASASLICPSSPPVPGLGSQTACDSFLIPHSLSLAIHRSAVNSRQCSSHNMTRIECACSGLLCGTASQPLLILLSKMAASSACPSVPPPHH